MQVFAAYLTSSIDPFLLQIIRIPLLMIPIVLGAVADAVVAVQRITPFLVAEELLEPYTIDVGSQYAVKADGDFVWEKSASEVEKDKANKDAEESNAITKDNQPSKKSKKKDVHSEEPKDETTITDAADKAPPFELKDIHIEVARCVGISKALVGAIIDNWSLKGGFCNYSGESGKWEIVASTGVPFFFPLWAGQL